MDNKKIVTILALISVVFIGVSIYILSSLTKEDEKYLDTGSVILTYSDSFKNGNVMLIENALPVSDEVGKISNKEDTYFDFTVTASAVKKDEDRESARKIISYICNEGNSILYNTLLYLYLLYFLYL